jgi:hypothetical protein
VVLLRKLRRVRLSTLNNNQQCNFLIAKPIAEDLEPKCEWRIFEGYLLQDWVHRVLEVADEESCIRACLEETSFECRSVDFNTTSNYCYINMESADRTTAILSKSSTFKHYERNYASKCLAFTKL